MDPRTDRPRPATRLAIQCAWRPQQFAHPLERSGRFLINSGQEMRAARAPRHGKRRTDRDSVCRPPRRFRISNFVLLKWSGHATWSQISRNRDLCDAAFVIVSGRIGPVEGPRGDARLGAWARGWRLVPRVAALLALAAVAAPACAGRHHRTAKLTAEEVCEAERKAAAQQPAPDDGGQVRPPDDATLARWRRLESAHFLFNTDQDPADAQRTLRELEDYFAAL